MKVIVTGASGFLGNAILQNLAQYDVITVARTNAHIIADLAVQMPNLPAADLVVHAAGKAHMVPKTEAEKQDFFDVNVIGTQNLLQALELSGVPKNFVFISSVAVYGVEEGSGIDEDHPLQATDPYGVSKIQAEQLITEWCKKHNITCAILRLPLLAGPNPPGNLKAMIKGIKKGYYFNIAGGRAKKSIVLVNDIAKIIPVAAQFGGVYNLTDGYHPSFAELSVLIAKQLNKRKPLNMPYFFARALAMAGDIIGKKSPVNSAKLKKMMADLTFDDSKARSVLGWKPTPVLVGFKI